MPRLRLGVLASGNGSNLQAILDASREGRLDAEVAVVVSNVATARALERAEAAGVRAVPIPHGSLARAAHESLVAAELDAARVDLVVLAGYMRLLTGEFLRRYEGRVLNIHPSLLPAFRGTSAIRQAFDAGVKVTGCTVHFVTEELDAGPIVVQAAVPVLEDDTLETLTARVHAAEHRAFPAALQLLAEGRVTVEGRRVRVAGGRPEGL